MSFPGKTYRRGIYIPKTGKPLPCLIRAVNTLGVATVEIIGSNPFDGEVIKEVSQDTAGVCRNSWRYEETAKKK